MLREISQRQILYVSPTCGITETENHWWFSGAERWKNRGNEMHKSWGSNAQHRDYG